MKWDPANKGPLIVLTTVTIAYVAYHYAANAQRFDRRPGAARAVFLQRAWGFVLLGVLPAIIAFTALETGEHGLGLRDPILTFFWFAGTTILALPFVVLSARRPASWVHYPQIREASWDRRLHLQNAGSWALYLVGYEFLFRGFLLMNLERSWGAWPAIAITTALYVFAHLPKNAGETIGTIPMGVVFAAAALHSGSIWAPFLAHLLIAVTSDWLVTRALAFSSSPTK